MVRKVVWMAIWAALAVGLGISMSIEPWRHFREQNEKARESVRQMRRVEHAKSELMREKAHLESPVGQEELARKNGFLKPGEKRLEIEHD